MPRQRIHHSRIIYVLPEDFPERLERFQEESGLSWAEIARRLGIYPHTIWRWRKKGVRPNIRQQMALLDLADSLGLGHIFTDWRARRETRHETPGPAGSGCRSERVPRPNEPPRRKVSQAGRRRASEAAMSRGVKRKSAEHIDTRSA